MSQEDLEATLQHTLAAYQSYMASYSAPNKASRNRQDLSLGIYQGPAGEASAPNKSYRNRTEHAFQSYYCIK